MIKLILISVLSLVNLQAITYEEFIETALNQNDRIKASSIKIKQTKQKAQKLIRYENPELGLELSKFEEQNGFTIDLSQNIPISSVREDLKKLAKLKIERSILEHKALKAKTVRNLSLKYVDYLERIALYKLAKEETQIAKKIYEISNARYHAGTVAKSDYLQAKLAYTQSLQNEDLLYLEKNRYYYSLLLESKITDKIELDTNYKFISTSTKKDNPDLLLYKIDELIATTHAKTDTRVLKSFLLMAEYEKEPDQNIYRVGINMPLALLNQKSEEKKIAALEIQKKRFSLIQFKKQINMKIKQVQEENTLLKKMQKDIQNLLKEEHKMLKMFEEGYKIANINLLQLQDLKNSLIQTKKRQIQVDMKLFKNNILKNYLTGVYND